MNDIAQKMVDSAPSQWESFKYFCTESMNAVRLEYFVGFNGKVLHHERSVQIIEIISAKFDIAQSVIDEMIIEIDEKIKIEIDRDMYPKYISAT